ncbi:MAG: FAD-binding protein [Sedimentisphaerales bacterium]|nr:FAD-binding protein [Sedimentisphaerales bacterium]
MIVGAGPAGATLARLIGRRYRVLLVDKRPFDTSPAHPGAGKCCGGLLAPDAQRMLSTLGLGLPKDVLEEPQLFVVKAVDLRQGLERYYQRHYINMDRQKFDAWLLSLVPAGVEVRTNCRLVSWTREREGFALTLMHGNRSQSAHARLLVGADGANSRVRRQLFPQKPLPLRYIAIQEWVERDHDLPYFTSLFDREITDYYGWTIPKADHLLIGAALHPGRQAVARFALLKERLRRYGFTCGRTVRRESAFIVRPTARDVRTGANGIALLGEAAGWISPSSAEGFSYAFRSALALAEALHETPSGFERRYHEKTRRLWGNILLKSWKSRVMFNPALRRAIMKSGLESVRIAVP